MGRRKGKDLTQNLFSNTVPVWMVPQTFVSWLGLCAAPRGQASLSYPNLLCSKRLLSYKLILLLYSLRGLQFPLH